MAAHHKHAVYEPGVVCFGEDKTDSWRIGRIGEVQAGHVTLEACDEDGVLCQPPLTFAAAGDRLAPLQRGWLRPVRDLLELQTLLEPLLLEHIRRRYWQDIIYTNIGPIVLALNPFNFNLPLYTEDRMPLYIEERDRALQGGSRLPTHTWSVAHNAYWLMLNHRHPQSILVSGESGAGKTEAAKLVLQYLATCSTYFSSATEKAAARRVTDKIQGASPILEAFGNAKTKRNANSSRFGKYMKLQFNGQGHLHGAYTINYLLERSRVVGHAAGERSYHTFYQLAAGAAEDPDLCHRFRLEEPARFAWLYAGVPRNEADVAADAAEFWRVRDAFSMVGFSPEEVDAIYRVVAGVLHLQALRWVPSRDTALLPPEERPWLSCVAELWGIDADALYTHLVSTTSHVRGDVFTVQHTLAQVGEVRDALSKALYERTFQYIVDRLNQMLDRQRDTPDQLWIGLLDIFGFEDFGTNHFEQLCINFANEQLQHHYNTCVFQRDLEQYEAENVNAASIQPPNNKPTLDLIRGILQLLNDQSRTGSSANFIDSVYETHHRHKSFRRPRIGKAVFGIAHYSGEVWYTATGMREKNVDPLKPGLRQLLGTSSDRVIAGLLALPPEADQQRSAASTVARFFQTSLQELVQMIDLTTPHWIRCIKPDSSNLPRRFCGSEVMAQLRCAGVLETIKIRQLGYPMRLAYADFWTRFRLLVPHAIRHASFHVTPGLCAQIQLLVDALQLTEEDCQVGLTKVFLKDGAYHRIEALRNERLDHLALTVQRFASQKAACILRYARWLQLRCVAVQCAARTWVARHTVRRLERERYQRRWAAAVLLQRLARGKASAQLAWRRQMLRHVAVVQAAVRAATAQRRVAALGEQWAERRRAAVQLVQCCGRAIAAERVAAERQAALVEWLGAELEVLAEAAAERRRAEAARREALKALIRQKAGAPVEGAAAELDVHAQAMQQLAEHQQVIEQQRGRIAGLEVELARLREAQAMWDRRAAEMEAAGSAIETRPAGAEAAAPEVAALQAELQRTAAALAEEQQTRRVEQQELAALREQLRAATTAAAAAATPAVAAAPDPPPPGPAADTVPAAEHRAREAQWERERKQRDRDAAALRASLRAAEAARGQQAAQLEQVCREGEAMVCLLVQQDRELQEYQARHEAWGTQLATALTCVERMLEQTFAGEESGSGASGDAASTPSTPVTALDTRLPRLLGKLRQLQGEVGDLVKAGAALTDFCALSQQLRDLLPATPQPKTRPGTAWQAELEGEAKSCPTANPDRGVEEVELQDVDMVEGSPRGTASPAPAAPQSPPADLLASFDDCGDPPDLRPQPSPDRPRRPPLARKTSLRRRKRGPRPTTCSDTELLACHSFAHSPSASASESSCPGLGKSLPPDPAAVGRTIHASLQRRKRPSSLRGGRRLSPPWLFGLVVAVLAVGVALCWTT